MPVCVASLAVFAVLTAAVLGHDALTSFDLTVHLAVVEHHSHTLEDIGQVVRAVSAFTVFAPLLLVVSAAVAWRQHRWLPLLCAAGATAVVGAVTLAAKVLIGRAGPDADPWSLHVDGTAYPSGHAAIAVVAPALLLALLASPGRARKAGWAGVLLWALLVGLTRIYVDEHWTSDVLAGWALGAAVTAGTLAIASRLASGARDRIAAFPV
ncbi:MAG TPA: phosphatase PAP2 family protein [Amycolatopsis sp.]|nr:phosphatase PAP2 family protein [Amycolatopsis sp.]